jgi:hypothetical protein
LPSVNCGNPEDPEIGRCSDENVAASAVLEGGAPTATTDRVCTDTSDPCVHGVTYESQSPTETQDRICTAVTECDLGVNYESQAPSTSRNRVCGHDVTQCEYGETVDSHAPTLTSNRRCRAATKCFEDDSDPCSGSDCSCDVDPDNCGEFERMPPVNCGNPEDPEIGRCSAENVAARAVLDRECAAVQQCQLGVTYQERPEDDPTVITNRHCTLVSECACTITQAATLTADLVCNGGNPCPP